MIKKDSVSSDLHTLSRGALDDCFQARACVNLSPLIRRAGLYFETNAFPTFLLKGCSAGDTAADISVLLHCAYLCISMQLCVCTGRYTCSTRNVAFRVEISQKQAVYKCWFAQTRFPWKNRKSSSALQWYFTFDVKREEWSLTYNH